jgi:hypothetical protein
MRLWVDSMFYLCNLLTEGLFAFLALWPLGNYLYIEFKGAPRSTLDWNDYCVVLVWYGYSIFCLRQLLAYLRRPDRNHDLRFLYYLLGLIPVFFLAFMLAMLSWGGTNTGN